MKHDGSAGMKARGTLDERPALAQIDQVGLATRPHAYGGPPNRFNWQARRPPALHYFSIHVYDTRLN